MSRSPATCSRKELASALSRVKKIAAATKRVLLRVDDDGLHLYVTDGELWIEDTIRTTGETDPFEVAIEYDALAKAIKACVASQFVSLSRSGRTLDVEAGQADAKIEVVNDFEPPPPPRIDDEIAILPVIWFADAIEAALPLVSVDVSVAKTGMRSVTLERRRCVATNGNGLVWQEVEDAETPDDEWGTIPRTVAPILVSYLKASKGEARVSRDRGMGRMCVALSSSTLTFDETDRPEDFPDYYALLPRPETAPHRWFEVESTSLLVALEHAATFSDWKDTKSKITVEGDRLVVECTRQLGGDIFREEIEIVEEEWDGEVGLNAKLACSVWKNAPKVVRVEQYRDTLGLMMARDEDETWCGIVMPMRLD